MRVSQARLVLHHSRALAESVLKGGGVGRHLPGPHLRGQIGMVAVETGKGVEGRVAVFEQADIIVRLLFGSL